MQQQDYQRIARAIEFITQSALEQPNLDAAAQHVGLSPFHFQRLFTRFAGVSPKRFLQHLTSRNARKLLKQSVPVLEASFAVGLSSPGRLHDLLISTEAVTPGELKSGGEGLDIRYGIQPTPYGDCLLAQTDRGICRLDFIQHGDTERPLLLLKKFWPQAMLKQDQQLSAVTAERIFSPLQNRRKPLALLLKGTNFQLNVWQALLNIPAGNVASYGQLSSQIGCPQASRAVGSAIGQNPIGYLIPCHRVLRGDGGLGGYRWGTTRKQIILGAELAATAE